MRNSIARTSLRLMRGAALVGALACADGASPPDVRDVRAPVTITATLTPAQQATVTGMSVEVSGPGIATPIIATLAVSEATVNGTVQVPVGASRTFTVRAFDAQGTETYNGSATASVVAGTNPPLTVRMTALEGNVPIVVTIGTYGVTLTPPTASVAVNGDVTLTANVTSNGATVAGGLTWGVVNPTFVTLTLAPDGRSAVVRGKLAGTTRVVASYEGVAAVSTVTITAAATNQPPVANANGPYTGTIGNAIAFSSAGSSDVDGSIVSYAWSFGDGATSTQANPSKAYTSAGSYTATLTVTDDKGATATSSAQVTVTAPTTGVVLASISAGATHACGLTADGHAWCWGSNVSGRLGNGSQSNTSGPVQVPALTFASISAGGNHTCGVSTTGVGYCWGDNLNGQIGNGTNTARPTPYAIPGLTFMALVAGTGSTCGLTTDGLAYCWGKNDKGQLGDGTTTGHMVPAAVSLGRHYSAITMGDAHVCALRAATEPIGRVVDCWGDDSRNQLGGSTTSPLVPGSVSGVTFSAISAGAQHTCGITVDWPEAASYCWGSNLSGQIGNSGASGNGMFIPGFGPYVRIDAGGNNSCGIRSDSRTNCWGFNTYGEVGDNSTSSISGPVATLGPPFTTVSVGAQFSCALSATGAAFCWGRNDWAQLGTGDLLERHAPAPVVWP